MAVTRWLGRALDVSQVDTITVADTWATDDIVTLTINTKSLVLTVGTDAATTNVATAIKEMINGDNQTGTGDHAFSELGSNVAEYDELTATVSGSVVTIKGIKGVPFVLGVTETTAGSGVATENTATAATGKNFVDNADNWTEGSAPGSSDEVYVENSSVSLLYGLDQLSGTHTSFNVSSTFTGTIGLPKTNSGGYPEYRGDYLEINASAINLGTGDSRGSSRIKINGGTVQTTINLQSSGRGASNVPAVLFIGTHASNVLNVQDGEIGIGYGGGEVATIATSVINGGEVRFGAGCTLTTITVNEGTVDVGSALTTLSQRNGNVAFLGSGAVTNLNIYGGTFAYRSSGTATTVTIGGSSTPATITTAGDGRAKTWTTTNLNENATINDPGRTVTYTNKPSPGTFVEQINTR